MYRICQRGNRQRPYHHRPAILKTMDYRRRFDMGTLPETPQKPEQRPADGRGRSVVAGKLKYQAFFSKRLATALDF